MKPPVRTLVSLALVLTAAVPALAKTVVVEPGPGTPVADAVATLADKDKLVFMPGTYTEQLVLDGLNKVRVMAKGKGDVVFTSAASSTILITGCTKVSVKGLQVRDSTGNQGINITNSQKVTVKRCIVENLAGNGVILIPPTTAKVTRCWFNEVTAPLAATGASVANFSNNSIEGTATASGIDLSLLTVPGSVVFHNEVVGAMGSGVVAGGPGNRVDKNLIRNCLFGITTAANSDMAGTVLLRNWIQDSGSVSVRLLSGGVTVTRNLIERAPATAVQAAGASEPAVVTRNYIRDTTAGVDVESANAVVDKNAITRTTNYGIRVRGGPGTSCSKNVLRGNTGNGFDIWTAGHTLTKNKGRDNGGKDLTGRIEANEITLVKNRFETSDYE